MKRLLIFRVHIFMAAAVLAAGLLAARPAQGATEDYSGRGMVFAGDGALYFEAEEGGVYLLEGLDLSAFEGSVVRVTGTVRETESAGPVLIVATVAQDERDEAGDAPRPGEDPGRQ